MKDDRLYLLHIRDAIDKILEYTALGESHFQSDRRTQDAVIRNIEIIGEATKQLSHGIRDAYPDTPWKKIAGMRDYLIHEYFGVRLELVWNVIQNDLRPLAVTVKQILER